MIKAYETTKLPAGNRQKTTRKEIRIWTIHITLFQSEYHNDVHKNKPLKNRMINISPSLPFIEMRGRIHVQVDIGKSTHEYSLTTFYALSSIL